MGAFEDVCVGYGGLFSREVATLMESYGYQKGGSYGRDNVYSRWHSDGELYDLSIEVSPTNIYFTREYCCGGTTGKWEKEVPVGFNNDIDIFTDFMDEVYEDYVVGVFDK